MKLTAYLSCTVAILTGCATGPTVDQCVDAFNRSERHKLCAELRPGSMAFQCVGDLYGELAEPVSKCYTHPSVRSNAYRDFVRHSQYASELSGIYLMYERGEINAFQREMLIQGVKK